MTALYRFRFTGRYSLTMIFLVVLICAMLPLLLIYYTTHSSTMAILHDEIVASLERQTTDFSDRLKDDISRVINTSYMLNENWELGKLSVIPDKFSPYEKAQTFQSIQNKIFLAQLSSRFIQYINVYFPTMDKCLSTDSNASKLQEMRQLAEEIDALPRETCFIRNRQMMVVSENTFSSEFDCPNLIVQVVISRRELEQFFHDMYSDTLSSGIIASIQDMNWPTQVDPTSKEAYFYNEVKRLLAEDENAPRNGHLLLEDKDTSYELVYSFVPYMNLLLIRYFDVADITASYGLSKMTLILFAAVSALSFLLIYYAIYRLVKRPLRQLMADFERVEQGDFNFEPGEKARSEFAFVFQGFSHMLSKLRVLMAQNYQQGLMVRQSEFKQLQAQIDPHFLYNGFFILNKRIRAGDNEGALTFSKLLSDYFRYVTQNARDAVPLVEEVAHAYNYVRIQQIRFPNRLTLCLDELPPETEQFLVPRLVLQPIAENVFRHVLDTAEGVTILRISYKLTGNSVFLCIEDNGNTLTEETLNDLRRNLSEQDIGTERSGLMNVHMRLRLYFGNHFGLQFDRSDMGGLLVRMEIPARKEGTE